MAGRLQIETPGRQDKYLTDNPEFSFFNQIHKKHTHFSKQHIKLKPKNPIEFDGKSTFVLPQNQGDMVSKISFEFELDPITLFNYGYVDSVGHAIIEYVDLIIGGTIIERITTDYLQIYSEQSLGQTKQYGLYKSVGKRVVQNATDDYTYTYGMFNINKKQTFVIDIPFYFYKKPELAIPLCAISKQEVEITIKFRKLEEIVISRGFEKFEYPQIPYQKTYDQNMNKDIHHMEFMPDLDFVEIDGSVISGIGVLTSETYTQNKITPYIYGVVSDLLQYYGISPYRITQFVPELERESIAFWRFNTNLIYKNTDPVFNKLTSGRAIGSGQEFQGEEGSSGVATVPKFNIFFFGTPGTGNVVCYVDTKEVSRINLGAGYGQSLGASDNGNIVAVGARDNTIKILDFSDQENPLELQTLDSGDPSSELRYVKISGNGNVVLSLDISIPNAILHIHYLDTNKMYTITDLEDDCHFGCSADGSKIVVGLTDASEWRMYEFDNIKYVLTYTETLNKPISTPVHVAISRDGYTLFYSEGFVIKTKSFEPFPKIELRNLYMNTEIIMLDEKEKRYLANKNKDFLITQIQQSDTQLIPLGDIRTKMRTSFNNSIKELYFVFQCQKYINNRLIAPCNYDNIDIDTDYLSNVVFYEHLYDLSLKLDGEEVINRQSGSRLFMKCIQNSLHHTRTPKSRRFYSYSFANEPEENRPTGQRNFSIVNNQIFDFNLIPQNRYRRELRIYALSYNILRLENGTARLMFQTKNLPVPTTGNGAIGPNDKVPIIFNNRFGYYAPCECPRVPNCPSPDDIPGDGLPSP